VPQIENVTRIIIRTLEGGAAMRHVKSKHRGRVVAADALMTGGLF
jgi:hypothetical protein